MILNFIIFFVTTLLSTTIFGIGMENYQQSTGAKGTLQCYGEPIKNARIKLYDADTFGFDYTMDEAISDWNGNFQVEGSHVEYTTLGNVLIIIY
uniref:Transthyretin-like family protein n=1 Tax=Parastrongyloides trichosuri TaxID=131310 RepID=A0A0N4Z8X2_PARTI